MQNFACERSFGFPGMKKEKLFRLSNNGSKSCINLRNNCHRLDDTVCIVWTEKESSHAVCNHLVIWKRALSGNISRRAASLHYVALFHSKPVLMFSLIYLLRSLASSHIREMEQWRMQCAFGRDRELSAVSGVSIARRYRGRPMRRRWLQSHSVSSERIFINLISGYGICCVFMGKLS